MKVDLSIINKDKQLTNFIDYINKKKYKIKETWEIITKDYTATNFIFKSPKKLGDIRLCHRKYKDKDTYTINKCNCFERTSYYCKEESYFKAMLTLMRL